MPIKMTGLRLGEPASHLTKELLLPGYVNYTRELDESQVRCGLGRECVLIASYTGALFYDGARRASPVPTTHSLSNPYRPRKG